MNALVRQIRTLDVTHATQPTGGDTDATSATVISPDGSTLIRTTPGRGGYEVSLQPAAGGPSTSGSMRSVQLKRGNQTVTEFDLYDLLLRGDKSKDDPLLPGDVIATGTPAGVGMGQQPPAWLRSGDVVRVEAEGLGWIENCFR